MIISVFIWTWTYLYKPSHEHGDENLCWLLYGHLDQYIYMSILMGIHMNIHIWTFIWTFKKIYDMFGDIVWACLRKMKILRISIMNITPNIFAGTLVPFWYTEPLRRGKKLLEMNVQHFWDLCTDLCTSRVPPEMSSLNM